MATQTTQPSPLHRAVEMNEVLRVWAQAIGCPVNQVTDVVRKAGLPMEKLWNSMNAGSGLREAN